MTEHLSQYQIEELIIDGTDQQARDHLISCASCRSQWGSLDEMLQLYRSSAMFAAHSVVSREPIFIFPQSGSRGKLPGLKWIFAGALLIGLSFPIFEQHREQQRHAAEIARDNLLLEQVDQAVSEPVPQPLESLRHLVVSEKTTTTPSNSKQEFNENE
jgi:hypothetical protein